MPHPDMPEDAATALSSAEYAFGLGRTNAYLLGMVEATGADALLAIALEAVAGGDVLTAATSEGGGCGELPLVRVSCVSASTVSFANLAASLRREVSFHEDSVVLMHANHFLQLHFLL